jgi:hypothetical protein
LAVISIGKRYGMRALRVPGAALRRVEKQSPVFSALLVSSWAKWLRRAASCGF